MNGKALDGVEGYTDFADRDVKDQIAHPTVQCGVVPVDLMDFKNGSAANSSVTRLGAFDACISARIAFNYEDWLAHIAAHGGTPDPSWTPPCATRFFDADHGCTLFVFTIHHPAVLQHHHQTLYPDEYAQDHDRHRRAGPD